MSRYTADFFKQNGNDLLDAVRSRFLDRLCLMWRSACNIYAKIIGASSQHYAGATASAAVSSSAFARCPKVESGVHMAPWNKHYAAATMSLPPLPEPVVGVLLCGHTVDAIDSAREVCKRYEVQWGQSSIQRREKVLSLLDLTFQLRLLLSRPVPHSITLQ